MALATVVMVSDRETREKDGKRKRDNSHNFITVISAQNKMCPPIKIDAPNDTTTRRIPRLVVETVAIRRMRFGMSTTTDADDDAASTSNLLLGRVSPHLTSRIDCLGMRQVNNKMRKK